LDAAKALDEHKEMKKYATVRVIFIFIIFLSKNLMISDGRPSSD
jgi:hypothetical protein